MQSKGLTRKRNGYRMVGPKITQVRGCFDGCCVVFMFCGAVLINLLLCFYFLFFCCGLGVQVLEIGEVVLHGSKRKDF